MIEIIDGIVCLTIFSIGTKNIVVAIIPKDLIIKMI